MSLSGLPDLNRADKGCYNSSDPQNKVDSGRYICSKLAKYGDSNTVTGYLSTWLSEWVREYGVDGFRCDTAKHVDKASWNQLKQACVSALESGDPTTRAKQVLTGKKISG